MQFEWIHDVLEAMGFPECFRSTVRMLLTGLQSRVKVNGFKSDPFSIWNSVKQGCPLAPYLYIISLQPLIDAIQASSTYAGIPIPGHMGRGTTEARVMAYADDLKLYMAGYESLRGLGPIMRDYNLASGADSNWSKCDGLRLGTLKGIAPHPA